MRRTDSTPGHAAPHPRRSDRIPTVRTLLLVDDEDPIRQLIARTLEADGYLVIEACDGASAWELWRARSDEICLVISDIRMPRMDGYELADRISGGPNPPPMVFISGYGQTGVWLPGSVFPKPFSMAALLAEVRRLLYPPKPGPSPGRRRRTPA